MDTTLINPAITAIFGVLGMIGSALIHLAKILLPRFQVKFDTVWDDRMRQAFTFWVGIIVVIIGSSLMLAWRYVSGDFPADPRDAALFAIAQIVQFVTNLGSYIAGNNTFFNGTKHLLNKPSQGIELKASIEAFEPFRTYEAPAIVRKVPYGADDTLRGGGAL
jgi:hypothetical protein